MWSYCFQLFLFYFRFLKGLQWGFTVKRAKEKHCCTFVTNDFWLFHFSRPWLNPNVPLWVKESCSDRRASVLNVLTICNHLQVWQWMWQKKGTDEIRESQQSPLLSSPAYVAFLSIHTFALYFLWCQVRAKKHVFHYILKACWMPSTEYKLASSRQACMLRYERVCISKCSGWSDIYGPVRGQLMCRSG